MISDPPPSLSLPPSFYDALLLISFGGPEGPDDVLPFLENVVRGKNVPRQRLLEVAKHYDLFGGVSPINDQNRALLAAWIAEMNAQGSHLPIYWGNLHWHPLLDDAVRQMAEDGVRHALAFVTSAFGSYPGCRQYLEAIEHAREVVGPEAPRIDKLRLFYNHPGFIESVADRVVSALAEIPAERRSSAQLLFTAHSIPVAMAERSPYESQLREACRLVVEQITSLVPTLSVGTECPRRSALHQSTQSVEQSEFPRGAWEPDPMRPFTVSHLAFQSRSGPPSQPWLEPNVSDAIRQLHAASRDCPDFRAGENGTVPLKDLIIVPIGFLAENIELLYDLDIEVRQLCEELGIQMVRAGIVGSHPRFVRMIRELVFERLDPSSPRLAIGQFGPWPDECPKDCCR